MSFGAGMGSGLAVGVGAGIAAGMAAGEKQAVSKIRTYLEAQGYEIRDAAGQTVELEQVLAMASRQAEECSSTSKWLFASLAVLGVVVLGTVLLWMMWS